MIFEHRVSDFHAGKVPAFLKLYDETGARELQMRILGNLVGYFVSEIGALNQTVHIWGYDSLDDRAARRAALLQEPLWQEFLGRITPMILRQESRILLPTEFSPLGAAKGETD